MKYRKPIKQYLILFICLTLLGACSKGVLLDELTNKGTEESPIMYYEGELFNGVGISLHDDGQLYVEYNYKSGKRDGLYREFYSNDEFFSLIDSQIDDWNYDYGELKKITSYENNIKNGICISWYKRELSIINTKQPWSEKSKVFYKDGKKTWRMGLL